MALVLKVPIHVDALIIREGRRPHRSPAFAPANTPENLFASEPGALAPGVHLHWALPDGLTRALESAEDSKMEFLPVPDVWVVLRYQPFAPASAPHRNVKAWAIDSYSGASQVITDQGDAFAQLRAARQAFVNAHGLADYRLTAAGFQHRATGEFFLPKEGQELPADVDETIRASGPLWAAYYPNVRTRFGFHDALTDLRGALDQEATQKLATYAVIGHYLDGDDDPLLAAGSRSRRQEFIAECNWSFTEPEGGGSMFVPLFPLLPLWELDHLKEIVTNRPIDPGPLPDVMIDRKRVLGERLSPWINPAPHELEPSRELLGDASPGLREESTPTRDLRPTRDAAPTRTIRPTRDAAPTVNAGNTRLNLGRLNLRGVGLEARPSVATPRFHTGTSRAAAPAGAFEKKLEGEALLLKEGADVVARKLDPALRKELPETQLLAGAGALASLGLVREAIEFSEINLAIQLPGISVFNPVASPYPSRICCHGAVIGVPLAPGAGVYLNANVGLWPDSATARIGATMSSLVADVLTEFSGGSALTDVVKAFHAGLLDKLGTSGGLTRLPNLLHQTEFNSERGGTRPRLVAVENAPADDGGGTRTRGAARGVRLSDAFVKDELADMPNTRIEVLDYATPSKTGTGVLAYTTVNDRKSSAFNDLLSRQPPFYYIDEPLPRWWSPAPPTLLVRGPNRGFRHGYDGRFDDDGQLLCRVTGQTVTTIDIDHEQVDAPAGRPPRGGDVLRTFGFNTARLPADVRAPMVELMHEVALLDPSNKQLLARAYYSDTDPSSEEGLPSQATMERVAGAFEVETEYWLVAYHEEANKDEVLGAVRFQGMLPSAVAVRYPAENTWSPLFCEWEATVAPITGTVTDRWTLGDVEHAPQSGVATEEQARTLRGRGILSAAAATTMGNAIDQMVEGDSFSGPTVEAADALARHIEKHDIMTCAMPEVTACFADDPVASGSLQLVKVRLVDTFGQTRMISGQELDVAREDEVAGEPTKMLLPPRLPYWARLMFRWMDGAGRDYEATENVTPVCGYLLPDYVEHALEVFDSAGKSLGQLRPDPRAQSEIIWEPAPGVEPGYGDQASDIANPFLRAFVQGLLSFNLAGTPPDSKDTALSAMIRVIDTVQDTVDRRQNSTEFVSTLVGRPVALTRARLRLESRDPRPEDAPTELGLEARLGSLTQRDDGLYGYFVLASDDGAVSKEDFRVFHPPHASVRAKARPGGPQAIADGLTETEAPIDHPFVIEPDPTVDLALGQNRDVILVMDPRSGVHATTGVLPRKRIALDRAQIDAALAEIAPTFRVGPVLIDATQMSIPVPAIERFDWGWTRRERPPSGDDGWSEAEVKLPPDSAILPERPVQIHEGWLRLRRDEETG
ncbi:MAG: hypothetical protein R3A51_01875 [Nannocystaceae bacterium]